MAVLLALAGLLVIGNIVTNRVVPAVAYVPVNLAVAAGVWWLARGVVSGPEMGLARWRDGVRWGLALAAATLAVYVAAAWIAVDLFDDRRVDGGLGPLAYHTLLRIPLGTVVLEELAFRGAVPAVLARRWGTVRGAIGASALFGLWHVLPAWRIDDVNPMLDRLLGDGWSAQTAGVTLAVGATFLAGLALCWLRDRSGSLLTTVLAHTATNSFAYAIAWLVTR